MGASEDLLKKFFDMALEHWPKIHEILALQIKKGITGEGSDTRTISDGTNFALNLENLFDKLLAKEGNKYKMKDRLNKVTDLSCLKECCHLPINTGAGGGLI